MSFGWQVHQNGASIRVGRMQPQGAEKRPLKAETNTQKEMTLAIVDMYLVELFYPILMAML